MKPLQSGIETKVEIVPRPDDTASAVGNVGIDVIATTTLILYIETACDQLIAPYYESGEATVGTRVEVDHLAPVRIGTPIQVSAKLEYDRAHDRPTKPTGLAPRAQYLSRFFGSFGTMEIVVTLPPGP